jgi:hypothetical protein
MRNATALTRRKFLFLGGAIGGCLLATPGLTWLASVWQKRERALRSRLIALFHNQPSARVIGSSYLQQHPQEANVSLLLKRVVPQAFDPLNSAGDRELMNLLQRRIRQDFREEKVVKLRGWILSATEARLCALAALA